MEHAEYQYAENKKMYLIPTKQIMFLHKGNITVKSKPGVGTKFTLTFLKRYVNILKKLKTSTKIVENLIFI